MSQDFIRTYQELQVYQLSACAVKFTDWITAFRWFQRLCSVINSAYLLT